MRVKKSVLCLAVATALSGCATTGDGSQGPSPELAGVFGALAGGALGALVCDKDDKTKCAIGGAVVGGAAAYYLTNRQRKIQAAAEREGVDVQVKEYVGQDGEKAADLGLEYKWYEKGDSTELSPAGKEKLGRIMTAREAESGAEPLTMDVGYTQGSAVARLLARERAQNLQRHIRENDLGDVAVGVTAHKDSLPEGASRIVVR